MAEAARSPERSHAVGRPRPQQDKPQPRGADGADGAGWRPGAETQATSAQNQEREAIWLPQGWELRRGASKSHTRTCAGHAQPLGLGGGQRRGCPAALSGKAGRGKACCPRTGGRRDTEGTASQAGRGGCPWSRGLRPSGDGPRALGQAALPPPQSSGTFLCLSRPPWVPRRGRQQRLPGALAGLGRPGRPLPHAPPVPGPQPPRGGRNVTFG